MTEDLLTMVPDDYKFLISDIRRAVRNRKLRALSWGVGLQSTTLLELSISGGLPKLDVAIFADTGFEYDDTYEMFDFYANRAYGEGILVVRIGAQRIFNDQFGGVTLPLFISGSDRMITRKCTGRYKIRPIHRIVRDVLGVNRRGRLRPDLVEMWLGITTDEIERAKDSRVAFINHEFPLLDWRWNRGHCQSYLQGRDLPVPEKSSCVFCPYKKASEWLELKEDRPVVYQSIVDLQAYINGNGLVKVGGQAKEMSFTPKMGLEEIGAQEAEADVSEMCDGGYCWS